MKSLIKVTLIACLILIGRPCNAQDKKFVLGKITDGYGNGLPGVSVMIKGTTKGIITDSDGKYKIPVTSGDKTLVASFGGFKTVEKEIEGKAVINFYLGEEDIELHGWCCKDHPKPDGPHCGISQEELKKNFGCKSFKRD